MKTKELVRMVREHRGPLFVAMPTKNNVRYIQVKKTELLRVITNIEDGELGAKVLANGGLYVDPFYT